MENQMATNETSGLSRRGLLAAAGALAAAPLVGAAYAQTGSDTASPTANPASGDMPHRMLGTLEVSAVGIGVQNMSRTYQTTVPTRSQMHDIIRAAYDNGVTFFDSAEAYGPWEVERILGEAVEGFRDDIVIA